MLCFLVSSQVHFALKAFSTQVTAKRFKTSVLSAVCYQIWTLTESFATYLTFVRLLSCERENNRSQLLILHLRPTHFLLCCSLNVEPLDKFHVCQSIKVRARGYHSHRLKTLFMTFNKIHKRMITHPHHSALTRLQHKVWITLDIFTEILSCVFFYPILCLGKHNM